MSQENFGINDGLRCKRSDGKGWRCSAMSLPDKALCEMHHVQAKRNAARSKRKSLCEVSNECLEEGDDNFEMIDQCSPQTPNLVNSFEESSSRDVGTFEERYRAYKKPFVDTSQEDMSLTEESSESVGQTCHHCRRKAADRFISCLRCNRKAFCRTCISTWYSEISLEETENICPVCRGLCNCKSCLRSDNKLKVLIQEIPILDKLQYLHRILSAVLPVIKKIHREQCAEIELEKNLRGTEIDVARARLKANEQMFCNICRIPIIDYFRHCFACSFDLCLICCQDIRRESSDKSRGTSSHVRDQNLKLKFAYKFPEWKANSDGNIPCPPKEYGGCSSQALYLARIFKMNWVAKLVKNAEDIVGGCKVSDSEDLHEKAHGEDNGDSFVYIRSLEMIKSEGVHHFEKKLGEGRVIVVERVLDESSFHSWDPEVMWKDEDSLVKAIDCLDGSEVYIRLREFMKVYREGRSRKNGLPLLWKLKDWPSPSASEEFVFYQRSEFTSRFPFLEYIHPRLGVLNVAAKLPHSLQSRSGPKIHVSCGTYEELGQGDSVTHLHYNMCDMVYLLVHTSEGKVDATKGKKPVDEVDLLMSSEARSTDETLPDDCKMEASCMDFGGARWDIFKRQDHIKLAEYLKVHMRTFQKPEYLIDDFASCSLYEGYYLNEDHKRQLKEEFGVEPLSFEQRRGEAIFIPAGLAYQVRNLKSNVQLAFDFLLPGSVQTAVRLAEEIRCLPNNHEAKHQILEIGKLSLYAASLAIKEVEKLVLDPKFGAELDFEGFNFN